jgi:hypothetical protein
MCKVVDTSELEIVQVRQNAQHIHVELDLIFEQLLQVDIQLLDASASIAEHLRTDLLEIDGSVQETLYAKR